MRVAYQTDPGLVRRSNEDCLFVDSEMGLFVVADGMGGHNAGEIASAMAIEEISRFISEGLAEGRDALQLMQESVFAAHSAIMQASENDSDIEDMGTTVVMALRRGDHFLICHVGDSRAYTVSDDAIIPLTRDHTFVAEWLEAGRITSEEARTHEARHGLTMAVGVDDEIEPVLACLPWGGNGCLILCSDGLTDMVRDEELLEIVRDSDKPKDACTRLVKRANENGGTDNVTIILVCP